MTVKGTLSSGSIGFLGALSFHLPDCDITTVQGLRCTTALRTVIDLATEVGSAQLEGMVRDCLDRHLFTAEEALNRVQSPDMATRQGAESLRLVIAQLVD